MVSLALKCLRSRLSKVALLGRQILTCVSRRASSTKGLHIPTKNIDIRKIANVTFLALEKSYPKEERRYSNHKYASNIQKNVSNKTPTSAKIYLKYVFHGLSFGYSLGNFSDPYGRPGDSLFIRQTPKQSERVGSVIVGTDVNCTNL